MPVPPPPPPARFATLHKVEYRMLRYIQGVPGLLPLSLAVHRSLMPTVITPLLSLIVWLVSLPRGASLITFVCAADLVNTAVKWGVQRPRPRWYSPSEEGLVAMCGAWEVDLSFPSAHTQFFAGLAFCAAALCGGHWLGAAAACGAVVGLTRNYLAMHWPSDTLAALVLGGALGATWGHVDPWGRLLRAGSPLLSLGVATAFTLGLLCLVIAVRQAVPPVASVTRNYWYANALASLPEAERSATLNNPRRQLRPRNLKSKIPMLATVWCTLAITGLYPQWLPSAAVEPTGPLVHRLFLTLVGLVGLGGVAALKKGVGRALTRLGVRSDRVKGGLKGLTYVTLCAWTFCLSQRTSAFLLRRLLGAPA